MKTSPAHRVAHRWLQARTKHQIDAQWITDVRKAWKALIRDRHFSIDMDAVILIDKILAWVDALTHDLMFVKGMWMEDMGATHTTARKFKAAILKELQGIRDDIDQLRRDTLHSIHAMNPDSLTYRMDGGRLWQWYKDKDPRSPQRAFMQGLRESVAEALDKIDNRFSRSLLGRFTRYLVKAEERHVSVIDYGGSDLEFSLGDLKLTFEDWIPTAMAGRGPLSTIPTTPLLPGMTLRYPDAKGYVTDLKRARQLLQRRDLDYLWYGQVILKCKECGGANPLGEHFGVGGHYVPSLDLIKLYVDPVPFVTELMIHELGHRYYYRFMTQEDRARFDSYFISDDPEAIQEIVRDWVWELQQERVKAGEQFPLSRSETEAVFMGWHPSKLSDLHAFVKKHFRIMPAAIQSRVRKFISGVPATSQYGSTISSEDFAEVFMSYVMGRDLTQDQIERFRQFLGRKKRASGEKTLDGHRPI